MKKMWLAPPVSVLTALAKYIPEVAFAGTAQEADTAQVPQSIKAVATSVAQDGCVCGKLTEGWIVVISRAPWFWFPNWSFPR